MRILITGSTGFIGNFLYNKFSEIGTDIVGISKRSSYESYSLDLTDPNSSHILKKINPDVIIHCAASVPEVFMSNGDYESSLINRKIDDNIINYCSEYKECRLIYFSSCSLYKINNCSIYEGSQIEIKNFYSAQKYKSENLIKEKLINFDILRISSPYSYNLKKETVLKKFIESSKNMDDLYIFNQGLRKQDFIHLNDIYSAIIKLLITSNSTKSILNIVNGNSITMIDLANKILTISDNNKSEILNINTTNEDSKINEYFCFSNYKALEMIGWKPTISIEDGLKGLQ